MFSRSINERLDVMKKSDSKNMEEEKRLIIVTENFEMKFIWILRKLIERKRIKSRYYIFQNNELDFYLC